MDVGRLSLRWAEFVTCLGGSRNVFGSDENDFLKSVWSESDDVW